MGPFCIYVSISADCPLNFRIRNSLYIKTVRQAFRSILCRKHGWAKLVAVLALPCMASWQAFPQGTFINMDFEHPILPLVPEFNKVPTSAAIPGWSAFNTASGADRVYYNDRAIESASVSLYDVSSTMYQPLAGTYSVLLLPSRSGPQWGGAVGQTGQVPASANSVFFLTSLSGSLDVSFGGQSLYEVPIRTYATYRVVAADISPFAGQLGELKFSASFPGGGGLLDNISFSTQVVPEPGTLALLSLGGIVFGIAVLRKSSRCQTKREELIE